MARRRSARFAGLRFHAPLILVEGVADSIRALGNLARGTRRRLDARVGARRTRSCLGSAFPTAVASTCVCFTALRRAAHVWAELRPRGRVDGTRGCGSGGRGRAQQRGLPGASGDDGRHAHSMAAMRPVRPRAGAGRSAHRVGGRALSAALVWSCTRSTLATASESRSVRAREAAQRRRLLLASLVDRNAA